MALTSLFNPDKANQKGVADATLADRHEGLFYYYHDPKIIHAVNVALATNRPLLVRGPSGCGKSCLAFNVARQLNARYYPFAVNSRSSAQDLLWRFDAVRRLGDAYSSAHAATETPPAQPHWQTAFAYVEPSVLWWAFDRESARLRGATQLEPQRHAAEPMAAYNGNPQLGPKAVVLIDQIDKADPDLANDLLEPFGAYQFTVTETNSPVGLKPPQDPQDRQKTWQWAPLLIITTNGERQLPEAFMRRCLVLDMELPQKEEMAEIACTSLQKQDKPYFLNLIKLLEQASYWPAASPNSSISPRPASTSTSPMIT